MEILYMYAIRFNDTVLRRRKRVSSVKSKIISLSCSYAEQALRHIYTLCIQCTPRGFVVSRSDAIVYNKSPIIPPV